MFTRPTLGRYKCDLVTDRYVFSGEMETGGPLLRYLNDNDRAAIRLVNVTATLLDPAVSSMSSFSQDEMMVLKDYTAFIRFIDPNVLGGDRQLGSEREKLLVYTERAHIGSIQQGLGLSEREKLLVYTERFVIQGLFHTSPERNRLLDIFEGPTGRWAAISDAVLHPLIPTTKAAPVTARLMLLNKTAIQFFHTAKP
jgi:hypothetical protein